MADLINFNRHNQVYDVPEADFDAYVARRVSLTSGAAFEGKYGFSTAASSITNPGCRMAVVC